MLPIDVATGNLKRVPLPLPLPPFFALLLYFATIKENTADPKQLFPSLNKKRMLIVMGCVNKHCPIYMTYTNVVLFIAFDCKRWPD